jgi:protein gp37
MAARSDIEWTTHTWNPVTGCTRVSAECDNCYAMNMAHRFDWGKHLTRTRSLRLKTVGSDQVREVTTIDWNGLVDLHPDRLTEPLRWREGVTIFVCSTSDLFHHSVPFHFIAAVFGIMAAAPRHSFQVLTKRPERMAEFFAWLDSFTMPPEVGLLRRALEHVDDKRLADRIRTQPPSPWPLPNVWCGTSVGVQEAKPRISQLQSVPAAIRFLSLEPLLEDLGELDLSGIHWVIAGGESGPRARPMHTDWVRKIRDQCATADVPFFFKQHGAYGPAEAFSLCGGRRYTFDDGQEVVRVGKKKAGRELDGVLHDAMPV